MRITRHFVTVGKRRVHYLRAGSGPALALLHACPVSAKVMRPLTLRVRESMKQPASYGPAWQAALSYPWRKRIKGLERKIRTIAAPQDVFAHLSPDAIRVDDNARSKARALR